ncbi:MAG: hypothetical protein ACI83W_001777 [Marinoscillum sp.]|jgi:hypothetical protein
MSEKLDEFESREDTPNEIDHYKWIGFMLIGIV